MLQEEEEEDVGMTRVEINAPSGGRRKKNGNAGP